MTTEQFAYWLQGFMETADPETIDAKQTQIIKDHLALVFTKKTTSYSEAGGKTFKEKPKQAKQGEIGKGIADDWYKKLLEENNLPIDIVPNWMKGPIYLGPDWPYTPIDPPQYPQPYTTIC